MPQRSQSVPGKRGGSRHASGRPLQADQAMTAALADMASNEDLEAAVLRHCKIRLGASTVESRREWRRKLQVAFYNQQATRSKQQSPQAQRGRAATAPQDRPLPTLARGTAAEVTPGGEGDGRSKSNARRKQPNAAERKRAESTSRTQPFQSTKADPNDSDGREQHIGGSGGSLEPRGPVLEPPGPLLTHLHNVYMAYSERLPTRLNPPAERTCFSQAGAAHRRGEQLRAALAVDVKVILTPPCIFHQLISLVILHTKYTGARQSELNVHA